MRYAYALFMSMDLCFNCRLNTAHIPIILYIYDLFNYSTNLYQALEIDHITPVRGFSIADEYLSWSSLFSLYFAFLRSATGYNTCHPYRCSQYILLEFCQFKKVRHIMKSSAQI